MSEVADELGLIDLAALDDEDGGLDDGIDRTKFPRPDSHLPRAARAAAAWNAQHEQAALADLDADAMANATIAKYATNWAEFGGWWLQRKLAERGGEASPVGRDDDPLDAVPDDIRAWVLALTNAGLKVPTIQGRLAAVRWHFEAAGRVSPTTTAAVAKTLDAAKRRIGTAQRRARPLMLDDLRRIVAGMPTVVNKPPDHIRVLRDRALLTLGWSAALRVSELAALNIEDIRTFGDPNSTVNGGAIIHITSSKTDQTATGTDIGVPFSSLFNSCPVRSTMRYTAKLNDLANRDPHTGRRLPNPNHTGPLFRSIGRSGRPGGRLSRQAIAGLVEYWVQHALGEDPGPYSGHSLRAGFVTECSNRGVPENLIRRTTRHTSSAGLDPYDRPLDHFQHAALAREWW